MELRAPRIEIVARLINTVVRNGCCGCLDFERSRWIMVAICVSWSADVRDGRARRDNGTLIAADGTTSFAFVITRNTCGIPV